MLIEALGPHADITVAAAAFFWILPFFLPFALLFIFRFLFLFVTNLHTTNVAVTEKLVNLS